MHKFLGVILMMITGIITVVLGAMMIMRGFERHMNPIAHLPRADVLLWVTGIVVLMSGLYILSDDRLTD